MGFKFWWLTRNLNPSSARELGEMGGPRAVRALAKAVSNRNASHDLRVEGVRALGKLATVEALECLVETLLAEAEARRSCSEEKLRSEVIQRSEEVSHSIEETLAALGTPAAQAILLDKIEKRRGVAAPGAFARVMAEWASPEAEAGLKRLLRDDPGGVTAGLAKGGARARERLLKLARDRQSENRLRLAALQALQEIGDISALDAIAEALQDEDPDVRVDMLGRLAGWKGDGGGRILAMCASALDDPNPDVRLRALDIIAQRGWIPEASAKVLALAQDQFSQVRKAAVGHLRNLRSDAGMEALLAAANDREGAVRNEAVRCLIGTGNPRARDVLIRALDDEYPATRLAAARALDAEPGDDPRVQQRIAEVIEEERRMVEREERVKEGFRKRQERLESVDSYVLNLGRDTESVWRECSEELIALGASAVDPILKLLPNTNPRWRERAAYVLGRIRAREAVNPLIRFLNDEYWFVRAQAAAALGTIGDPAAVTPLKAIRDQLASQARTPSYHILHYDAIVQEIDGALAKLR